MDFGSMEAYLRGSLIADDKVLSVAHTSSLVLGEALHSMEGIIAEFVAKKWFIKFQRGYFDIDIWRIFCVRRRRTSDLYT